jgi:hypothetical protein
MTHDKLLASIIDYGQNGPIDYGQIDLSNALRAVVELHKPQDITLPNGKWGTNCILCDGFDYPCPTIRIIEKELA